MTGVWGPGTEDSVTHTETGFNQQSNRTAAPSRNRNYRANGRGQNGHVDSCHGANGNGTNGHGVNGHDTNGYGENGYGESDNGINDHKRNGHGVDGHGSNGHKESSYQEYGQEENGQEEKEVEEEEDTQNSSFLHWKGSLKEQSGTVLKMIYFFQVLPFYLLQFSSGMSLGFPSVLVPQLISGGNSSSVTLDTASKGWIVSLDYGITAVVALLSGHLQLVFGPKRTSLLACVPICLSWLVMATAQDITAIYASRMLVGLGNGILTSSVYIVEVVSADNRGSVVMVETAFRSLGLIAVYLLGALLHWQTMAWFVIPLPIFAFFYGLYIPESPIFLTQVAGYSQLDPNKKGGGSSRTPLAGLARELGNMVEVGRRRDVYTPVLLLVVLLVGQQCSGMKIIQGYAVEIFADTFSKDSSGLINGQRIDQDAYWSAVVMASVRLLSTLLVAKYIHNFGRKTMYFLSAGLTIIFQVLFGVIVLLDIGYTWKIAPLGVICGQVFCLQLGIQTIPYLLSSELFPNDARASCKGLIRAISAVFSFSMLKVFPYLEDHLGLYGSFWGLASVLLLILPIVFLCVPEAKDVDLDQVAGFFEPATTKFYTVFPLTDTSCPSPGDSVHRIRMVENIFGTAGRPIQSDTRSLLAEGLLLKTTSGRAKRRHFFLFSDILVWGSVLRENINCIRQRIVQLQDISLQDIQDSTTWILSFPGCDLVLEADTHEEKVRWMLVLTFAVSRASLAPTSPPGRALPPRDLVVAAGQRATHGSSIAVEGIFSKFEGRGRRTAELHV